MNQRQHPRLDAFVSLGWYDTTLRFITNFIAKTSELLLAAGLVVSTANFLTDGTILGTTTPAAQAWAWTQATAIDSSLGLSFYYVLVCFRQHDWIKCTLYGLLTGLLAVVAGAITNVDVFSHAIHVPINDAISVMGLNVQTLSGLRSIAVVGFVLMSRLRDVSFRDLSTPEPLSDKATNASSIPISQNQKSLQTRQVQEVGPSHLSIEDVALLVQMLTRTDRATMTNVTVEPEPEQRQAAAPSSQWDRSPKTNVPAKQAQIDLPQSRIRSLAPDPSYLAQNNGRNTTLEPSPTPRRHSPVEPEIALMPQSQTQKEPVSPEEHHQDHTDPSAIKQSEVTVSREERLEHAYKELVAEGRKVSGRTLAERAHMHRSLCTQWLRANQKTRPGGIVAPSVPHEQTDEYAAPVDRSEHAP